MKVWYVTMIFPALDEAFACVDVRILRSLGVDVSVHALRSVRPKGQDQPARPFSGRSRQRAAEKLLAERALGDLCVTQSTVTAVLRGVLIGLLHPAISAHLTTWLLRHSWRSPTHLLKSLALVPRSLDIFFSARRHRPHVIHLFWGHYPAIVGHLVERYLPDVVVSVFLGAYDLERRFPGSARVARAADVVWTHAKTNVDAIERQGVPRNRIRVMYRGIDLAVFAAPESSKVRQRIVTAGRLSTAKGMPEALRVFAKVREHWPGASLVVLGDGPERSRLADLSRSLGITDAVTFRGHVKHEHVRDAMAEAEVFLFMSKKETERLPNVVKEAMANRCICVTTDTPGIDELVADGTTGFVVRRTDVVSAAQRIDSIFGNPEQSAAMAEAARRHIVDNFDAKRSMEQYRDCWRRLLNMRSAARDEARLRPSEVPRPTLS